MTAVAHIWNNCIYMQPDTQVNHQIRYYFKQGEWQQGCNRITRTVEPSWVLELTDSCLKIKHYTEIIEFELRPIKDEDRPNYLAVGVERMDLGITINVGIEQ